MSRHRTSHRPAVRHRGIRFLVALLAVCVLWESESGRPIVQAQGPNGIAVENGKPGAADWDITGAGDDDVQGFATDISVNIGQTVHFKIAAPGSSNYQIKIYRLGYYGGSGATEVTTIAPSATLPQAQAACLSQPSTGLVDCGNWTESAAWTVPLDAVSGIYLAKPVRTDNGHRSHIVFIVRDDNRTADIVFQTSDTTWQAYNQYPGFALGGASLYCGGPLSNAGTAYTCAGRAAKVSYNRPFDTRNHDPQSFLFNAEYPMVRWLEANGYDVKYQSGVDTDRHRFDLTGTHRPKAFLSVGHDEYWSGAQRDAVQSARNAGVNLAFMSGNEMFWKTRYEPSIDGTGTAHRTLVSYKETLASAKIDPAVDPITGAPIWTGTWRDPRFSPPGDGGNPENGVTGQIWTVNCCSDRIKVPADLGKLRFWRNTWVADLAPGEIARMPVESLGYEWDEDLDNGARPSGLVRLSSATYDVAEKVSDFGAHVGAGRATHSMTLYRHNSGALVFGAGTVQWSWGLDGDHDRGDTLAAHTPDQGMQQASVNLLADMGVQPTTLQVGANPARPLVAATKSTDIFAPTSSVVSPAAGASVPSGSRVTITGTAAEQGGGTVAGVEVSVDGGATWHAAQGTSIWSYDWTPGTPGSVTIRSRAVDENGNLEAAAAGNSVVVVQGDCPCTSLWKPITVPPVSDFGDASALELGVKFSSDINGFITGIRYFKSVSNTGTHLGNLWTMSGALLASATFTNESQSGWQQVLFNSPVAITAGTTYIASYHTNVGHYAATPGYFASAPVDSPPLHAQPTSVAGGNGVFAVGNSAFPTQTFNATNYWVDVVFSPTNVDSAPPVISNIRATTIDSSRVAISWTTDEPASSQVEYSIDFNFPQAATPTVNSAAFVTSRSMLLSGLKANTTYYYRVTSTDPAGNVSVSAAPSFTVPGPTLRDTAQADFLAGTLTGTYASETADGELMLPPTIGTEFSGTSMPPGWMEWPYGPNGYSVVGGGGLIVDGVRVAMCATDASGNCVPGETLNTTPSAIFAAPHSLEFVATFTGDAFQHAGLGQTLGVGTEPWAIFSTLSGGALNARTNTGTGAIDTFLGSGLVGAPHLFRIDWKATSVDYYVDGSLVVTHPLTVVGPMRPIAASDFNEFGGNVTVNWVRMAPYAPAGTFTSRVFDAQTPVDWHTIQWTASAPAGTTLAISVRTGNTPAPDAADSTWTAFQPIATGGPLALHSQFIQYRADLTTADTNISPRLDDIIISTGHVPVANPDRAIVPENGNHVFLASGPSSLIANDTDADPSDILQVVAVTPPSHGSTVQNADGSVTYTPAATYFGPDSFAYTVSDGLLTASASVSLDVRFGNIPPVANNDFYTVNEDAMLSVAAVSGVLANDTDTEHDALSALLTSLPLHGTLALGADGAFNYAPFPNYAGPDSFRYKATDGANPSNEADVQISVNQVNDPPITVADAYVAVLNQPLDVPAAFTATLGRYTSGLLANDRDVEVEDTAPLHAVLVSGPRHGQLVFGADGGFSYTPAADFLGADSFTYKAADHFNAEGNVVDVTITVALKAIAASVDAGATVTTGSGTVDEADPLHSSVTSPTSATVAIAQGVISASQAPAGYTFLNQQVNISVTGADGTDITASSANPIVLSFTIDQSLVPPGQDYTTLAMFRNGVLIPECPGATTIPAATSDPCVTRRAAAADGDAVLTIITSHASRWNVGVSSAAIGDAPIAMNDGPYLVAYQTPLILPAPGVLVNDIGRSSLAAAIVGTPVNGAVSLAPSGAFTFTPNPAACGASSFQYIANDATSASAPATVSMTIDCQPRPIDDSVTLREDSGVSTITVLANDTDPVPGETLSVSAVSQPANGTAAIATGGAAVTYQPNANFFGSDSFAYTVSDGRGNTATAIVKVTVASVNDAPRFTAGGNVTVLEDAGRQAIANWATGISAGAVNESTQALNFVVTNSKSALFSAPPAVSAAGTLTFTPAVNANGSAIVTVMLRDDGGTLNGGVDTSAAQTFTVTITAVNDAPSFTRGADQTVPETAGAQTIANWATNLSAGPANEIGQALNFLTATDNAALFAVAPAISTSGTLMYTIAPNLTGINHVAHVTVRLHDNGGTANGGTDTSAGVTLTISVTPSITISDVMSAEGSGAPNTFTFSVALAGATDHRVTVAFTTADGTATVASGDFESEAGTLTFPIGGTRQTVRVVVGGDVLNEDDETFSVILANPSGATIKKAVASAVVLNDDPIPSVSVSDSSVTEGNAGTTNMTFTVTLSALSGKTVTVNYATSDGSAMAPADYTAQSGTLTFAPGSGSRTITVPVTGDTADTPDKTFLITLSAPVNATLGAAQATGTILDDDPSVRTYTTVADFTPLISAAADASTYIAETADGEVTLTPAIATEFSGSTLPPGWISTALITGSYIVSNGSIKLQGTQITSALPLVGVGRTLEFAASFSGAPQQFAGLLLAQFVAKANGTTVSLYARTVNAVNPMETLVPGNWFDAPHRFRIDWTTTNVVYWIDGAKVAVHNVAFPSGTKMTIVAGDSFKTGGVLTVDWMRLSPYGATGTYTSNVFDAGAPVTWQTLSWAADKPAGTTVALAYRTGNTPVPDATWTSFTAVTASGGALAGTSRYLQFQIVETTSVLTESPAVSLVQIEFNR